MNPVARLARFATVPAAAEVDGQLCPRAVADIRAWVLYEKAEGNLYCVGSLEQDKFIAVPQSKIALVLEIAAWFDGLRSIDWIQEYYLRERQQQIDVTRVYQLLSEANLIADPKPTYVFRGEFKRFSVDVLDFNVRGFFERTGPHIRKIFKPILFLTLLVILLGMASFRLEYSSTQNLLAVQNSYTAGFLILVLIGPLLTFIHEFAHAFTAVVYGAQPRHLKAAMYLGLPTFYTEIAGMYTLKPQDRIKVWAAGCYGNLCFGSAMLLLYRLLPPDASPALGQIVLKVSLGSLFAIIGNLFPLLPTDGYFIVSTLIKRVNLRTNAFQEFLNWLRGKDSKFRGGIVVYFLASSFLLLGVLILQVKWFIEIVLELLGGSGNWQSLLSNLTLPVIALLVVFRVAAFLVARARHVSSRSA